jgi:hypothetical protein
MASLIQGTAPAFVPLPIDGNRGFPQVFPVVFGGATYRVRLYVNASQALLGDQEAIFELPKMSVVRQQILKLTGFAPGAKFTLSLREQTTANIDYSDDPGTQTAALDQALNSPAFVGAGNSIAVAPEATKDGYLLTFGDGIAGNALPITGAAIAPSKGTITSATVRPLPAPEAFLVVRVEKDFPKGGSDLIFLRKVAPGLIYAAGNIALTFPTQRVAVRNLNGQGAFGSQVTGGIAARWA